MSVGAFDQATLPPDIVRLFGDLPVRTRTSSWSARSWASLSERGTRRRRNEDIADQDGHTFVVADGMGGRPGGAEAAEAAVTELLSRLRAVRATVDWTSVVSAVNEAVRSRARSDGHERSGAAFAAIHVSDDRVTVLHLGDVRVYRLRVGVAEQLTVDHNVARQLAGSDIDPGRLRLRPHELNALTGYLGDAQSWAGYGVRSLATLDGDRLAICSDGVHRHVGPDTWRQAHTIGDVDAAALLVRSAQSAGATDDATALVLSLERRSGVG